MAGFLAGLGRVMGALTGLGQVAGNAAQGSASNRQNQNQQALQQSALLANLYNTRQNAQSRALESGSDEALRQGQLGLQQRQFGLQAPAARARQMVQGSLLQNMQPTRITGLPPGIQAAMGTQTGGLTPEAFSPQVRQMGAQLQRDALLGQLKGDQFDPMTPTNFQGGLLVAPQLKDLEKSGMLENILGGTGLIASLLGSLNEEGGTYGRNRTNPIPSDESGWG
jgi:hypothetical protein